MPIKALNDSQLKPCPYTLEQTKGKELEVNRRWDGACGKLSKGSGKEGRGASTKSPPIPALHDLSPTQGKRLHTQSLGDCLKQLAISHLQWETEMNGSPFPIYTVQNPLAREMVLSQLRWVFQEPGMMGYSFNPTT